LTAQKPLKVPGGQVRIVDSSNFPAASTIAAALVEINPGGMRELHWHPHDEWQYYISGRGRMTVFASGERARTFDYQAGDVDYIPFAMAHYVENRGEEPLRLFVEAVQEVFPKCCVHFEDWTGTDAVQLLERYRNNYCVYNDEVQGTAGIVLAGMINAAKVKGTKLSGEKYLLLGAGSAGIGLANLICSAMVQEGLTREQARSRIYMFDINGLLEDTRKDLVDFQKPYAHRHRPTRDFVAAIESIKPTTIIGVSTVGGTFTQKVVQGMARINERPVIFALSNPTDHAECTPEQAYTWSDGRAIYVAGVQFPPVHFKGETFCPARPTTSMCFQRSEWPCLPRRRPESRMRCSSKRLTRWPIRCHPNC
jgi:mannose-6-phosphate isomerase-like protein (cupin superfamily)